MHRKEIDFALVYLLNAQLAILERDTAKCATQTIVFDTTL